MQAKAYQHRSGRAICPSSPRTPQPCSTRTDVRCAAADTAASRSAQPPSVVERRAVDVVVIGAGPLAAAVACSLARRNKKVVLIPDFGIRAAVPSSEGPRQLLLPCTNPLLTHLSQDAAAYWRGLQMQLPAARELLIAVPTLELAAISSRRSEQDGWQRVAETFSQLQDSCKEAGVKLGSLQGQDLQAVVPLLRGLQDHVLTGLLQPDGGVINPGVAVRALTSLATRSGALLRERLVLQGWRDEGDHFTVSASAPLLWTGSAPPTGPGAGAGAGSQDAVSVFEAEQLVLAPDESRWPLECLQLFGLELGYLEVQQREHGSCAASRDLSKLPLTRFWGQPPAAPPPAAPAPPPGAAPAPPPPPPAAGASNSAAASSWQYALYPVAFSGSKVKLGGPPTAPAAGQPPITAFTWNPTGRDLTQQRQHAASMIRGLEGTKEPAAPCAEVAPPPPPPSATGLCLASPDGMPVIGFHPGFESGRVLVAVSVSGLSSPAHRARWAPEPPPPSPPEPAGPPDGRQQQKAAAAAAAAAPAAAAAAVAVPGVLGDGFQLAPLLAKAAADMLAGISDMQDMALELIALDRPGLPQQAITAASRPVKGVDGWGQLHLLQDGSAFAVKKSLEDVQREEYEQEERRKQQE